MPGFEKQLQKNCPRAIFSWRKLCTGFLVDVLNGCGAGSLLLNPIPAAFYSWAQPPFPFSCSHSEQVRRRHSAYGRRKSRSEPHPSPLATPSPTLYGRIQMSIQFSRTFGICDLCDSRPRSKSARTPLIGVRRTTQKASRPLPVM